MGSRTRGLPRDVKRRRDNERKGIPGTTLRESARRTGPALGSFRMSESRFNATLRDGQAVGLPVDAFPSGWVHRVWKRGCAFSGEDTNTEQVTNKLQIQLEIIKLTVVREGTPRQGPGTGEGLSTVFDNRSLMRKWKGRVAPPSSRNLCDRLLPHPSLKPDQSDDPAAEQPNGAGDGNGVYCKYSGSSLK